VLLTYLAMVYFSAYRNDRNRFLASCFYIVFMLAGAAYALYPNLLPASTGAANSLTIYNSAAGAYSLGKGIYWWSIGMAIAVAYFVLVYSFFRGKATTEAHAYHH
jgi:cytochrome bd ubiquinol oxidase subunit II